MFNLVGPEAISQPRQPTHGSRLVQIEYSAVRDSRSHVQKQWPHMTQDKVHIRETFGTVAIFSSRLEIVYVTFVASFRWKTDSWAVEFKWSAKLGRPRTTWLTSMFLVTNKSMGSIGMQEDSKSACFIYLFIYLFFLLFCNKTSNTIIQSEQILHKRQHLQISTSNRHELKIKERRCTEGYVPDYFLDRVFILPGFPALPVPVFAGSSSELLHAGIKLVPVFFLNSPAGIEKHLPKGQNVPGWVRWAQ